MLVSERLVRLTIAGRAVPVRIAIAGDLARVSAAQFRFATDLAVALGILALVLALATSVQVGLGLRPLDLLRRGVAEIRAGKAGRLPAAAPSEVGPLVEEVNALLDAQEREVERSRGRAADLAHGLKTPLAALAADAERLRRQGDPKTAAQIELATEQMRRHVERELSRARIRSRTLRAAGTATLLRPLVEALVTTLSRTPRGEAVRFDTAIPDDVTAPFDRTDLAEVLGNLLENAARHARVLVRIAATSDATGMRITIDDDGVGIDPARCQAVLAAGRPFGRTRQRRARPRHRAGCSRSLRVDAHAGRLGARRPAGDDCARQHRRTRACVVVDLTNC